jgi:UDP-glucuronate decarboxylase
MVDGFIRMMRQEKTQGPVNLGNPVEISMRDLAARVCEATGSKSKIVRRPLPKDDPRRRRPDISRAKRLLRWSPKVPLAEGIAKTVEYFRHILEEKNKAPASKR